MLKFNVIEPDINLGIFAGTAKQISEIENLTPLEAPKVGKVIKVDDIITRHSKVKDSQSIFE